MVHPLDFSVSKAVTRASLMETALHARGAWEMALDELRVSARRVIGNGQVSIEAEFPMHCWIDGATTRALSLLLDGEVLASKQVAAPGDGAFAVSWSFSVEAVEYAA